MTDLDQPLRVLITNNTLADRAGSELYVRDVALALVKRGHHPVAYSPVLGDVADELRQHTIPVIDDLKQLSVAPDLIHGHHHHETMTAALHFPDTPALLLVHGWAPWQEEPFPFPNIMKYAAVDDLCRERLLTTDGINPNDVKVILNFVDCERFKQVRSLPVRPKTALVFSNYADAVAMPIQSACASLGIETVDIYGHGSGKPCDRPEDILADYDIVFAKARSALEAMASGCAVIVTDFAGIAGMVTTDNLQSLRRLNFGARTLQTWALSEKRLRTEIEKYNAEEAGRVTQWVRKHAHIDNAVDQLLDSYRECLAAWQNNGAQISDRDRLFSAARYLRSIAPRVKLANQHASEKEIADAQLDAMLLHLTRVEDCLATTETELAVLKSKNSIEEGAAEEIELIRPEEPAPSKLVEESKRTSHWWKK